MDFEKKPKTLSIDSILLFIKKIFKKPQIKLKIINFDNKLFEDLNELKLSRISDIKKLQSQSTCDTQNQNISFETFDIYPNQFGFLSYLYDGFLMQDAYRNFLNLGFNDTDIVVLTDKLACTFDESDARYHARTIVFGTPTIISFPGIVMGPARPRNYYLKRLFYRDYPESLKLIDSEYLEKFIDNDDFRINDAISLYMIQYFFFKTNGNFYFCRNKCCILYNCHWQEELIYLIQNGYLCKVHLDIMNKL